MRAFKLASRGFELNNLHVDLYMPNAHLAEVLSFCHRLLDLFDTVFSMNYLLQIVFPHS